MLYALGQARLDGEVYKKVRDFCSICRPMRGIGRVIPNDLISYLLLGYFCCKCKKISLRGGYWLVIVRFSRLLRPSFCGFVKPLGKWVFRFLITPAVLEFPVQIALGRISPAVIKYTRSGVAWPWVDRELPGSGWTEKSGFPHLA